MSSGLRTPDTPGETGGLIVMVRPDPADAARAIADSLHAALATLGDRLISCTVDFASPLPLDLLLKLRVGDQDFSPDPVADCSGQDGWRFVDPGQTAVELCGSACAAFKQRGSADFIYSPC